MKCSLLQKNLAIGLVVLLIATSAPVIGSETVNSVEVNQIDVDKYLAQIDCDEETQQEINKALNNNDSSRYLIITGGIRASSYFVKLPRLFTQRGIIFSGEIWYRSLLALTIVFEKNDTGVKLVEFERGTHRVIFFGIGHSSFSRPHFFSFGRLIAFSSIKPIVF